MERKVGMTLKTKLTDRLGIRHPVLLAPMDLVAGGRLAAAVSDAGGLGLIGGGYGDAEWLASEFDAAGKSRVGVGFITWSLATRPALLDMALERRPAAVMLSFGDPAPFVERIKRAGAVLICQIQTVAMARDAVAKGAAAVIAGEAVDLIDDVPPAAIFVERMVSEAERLLGAAAAALQGRASSAG